MSGGAARTPFLGAPSQWTALVLVAVLGLLVATYVDLEPKVERDFFFSSDDPQLRGQEKIDAQFGGSSPQIYVAVRSPRIFTGEHLRRVHELTVELAEIDGVEQIRSLTEGPMEPGKALEKPGKLAEEVLESPVWSRMLLSPDREASFLVMRLAEQERYEETVRAIDRVADRSADEDFRIGISGVPYVSKHIRRGLASDLEVFTVAALIAFAVLMALLFRSAAAVVGMMTASLTACFLTFLARPLAGLSTALLTPNLWTIAFVLTLSHVVYLTANYRRIGREKGEEGALRESVRQTGPPSAWSLVANLLGFLSLLLAPAKPLREFGISGGIAAVAAVVCAYGIYPLFLRSVRAPRGEPGRLVRALDGFFTTRHPWLALAVAVAALALAPFAWRVDTDPALPSYFAREGEIRRGVEMLDRAGGTSPLEMVVRDAHGGALDDDESFARLAALQRDLEEDPAVGSVPRSPSSWRTRRSAGTPSS